MYLLQLLLEIDAVQPSHVFPIVRPSSVMLVLISLLLEYLRVPEACSSGMRKEATNLLGLCGFLLDVFPSYSLAL